MSKKTVMSGNNVSHAINRTRRRFLPNLQNAHVMSETLDQTFAIKISTKALRTIDAKGGLDHYLRATPNRFLSDEACKIKKRVIAKLKMNEQTAKSSQTSQDAPQ
ncbi:MAG: 50S ribosomal protein L28 [Pseudomonadota bacterium]